jgi:hypothetical protein
MRSIALDARTTVALLLAALAACSTGPAAQDPYNAYLETIAKACKPLIIGSDDMGQAIVFNGLGATQEHYGTFLSQTSSLYRGAITPDVYRGAMTSFVGSGTYNARSFDCIVAHLPVRTGAASPATK